MDPNDLTPLKSLRLLYVEDDPATREELALMLEPWVATLDVAADGQEGLALFRQHRPDIVVTDIQMPVMGGLAMSAEIRRLAKDQPIVVLSAYNDVEFLFRAIELGIGQYLTKPVNVAQLLGRLAEMADGLLARREQRRNRRLLEQYRLLADESALVSIMDAGGRITYVNDRLRQVSGFAEEDLLGLGLEALRHPDESATRLELIWKGVQSGEKWAGIVKNRTREGQLLAVERSLVPITDHEGRLQEVFSLDVDITDLYTSNEVLMEALSRNESTLREQRVYLNAYKRALESGTCICITDAYGRILSTNRQFSDLLGYGPLALRDQDVAVIVPSCDQDCLQRVKTSASHGESQVLSVRHRTGSELYFSVVFVPVQLHGGQVESLILVCQDITESLELAREVMDTQRELLTLMGELLENRSMETGMHVRRVSETAALLAHLTGLSQDQADQVRLTSALHDVGKVGMPDSILHKPGKLEPNEFAIMRTHPVLGFHLLERSPRPLVQLAARIAHEHHERYDGNGYPRGLAGEAISLEARIVAIADVVDALAQARSYKPAWDDTAILEYLRSERGGHFDPHLVDLALAHWDEIADIRRRFPDY